MIRRGLPTHERKMNRAVLSVYTPKTGAPNFMKEILLDLKPKINHNTVVMDGFIF